MIKNRNDLKCYIAEDFKRYSRRKFKFLSWILGDESYEIKKYLYVSRHLEYYSNKKKLLWEYIPFAYYLIRFRRMRISLGIQLNVNTIGKGLYIPHYAGGIYANCERMGDNCIISTGVVLGDKGGVKILGALQSVIM